MSTPCEAAGASERAPACPPPPQRHGCSRARITVRSAENLLFRTAPGCYGPLPVLARHGRDGGYQGADAAGAPAGPHQGLAVRGRAAKEVVYGDVTADARNDRAGRCRNPADHREGL